MLKLTNNRYGGKLIVFEGTDGAGKSTMIRLTAQCLSNFLGAENILVTKQPTDMSRKTRLFQKMMYCSQHGEIDYRAVQLLTLSDRVQHNHEVIIPALKAGKTVICDRYIYTSVANMLARGYTKESWFFNAARCIVKPDLSFLAYVKPSVAIKRIKSRPEEKDRHLNEALLTAVADRFLKMKRQARFVVLPTDREENCAFKDVTKKLRALYGGLC